MGTRWAQTTCSTKETPEWATEELAPGQAVLKAFLGHDQSVGKKNAMIASAPIVPSGADAVDGIETILLHLSMDEKASFEAISVLDGDMAENEPCQGGYQAESRAHGLGEGVGIYRYWVRYGAPGGEPHKVVC
jgi:hypothetical protein